MAILDRFMKKEIQPQQNLIEDLRFITSAKKNKSVAVEYVMQDGSVHVVLLNVKSQIALCYDNTNQLNMEMRMIWGSDSKFADFINTASDMSREVDTNRYHIFANAFTHSSSFVDYIDSIYRKYSLQKLVELKRHYDNDNIYQRNVIDIPASDASKLGFLNCSIDEAAEELEDASLREYEAVERIGLEEDEVFSLKISDAVGLDENDDIDQVLIGAAEAEGQTIQDIKNKSTGFLFADMIERISLANEYGWMKLSHNDEAVESYNTSAKDIPDYDDDYEPDTIEGIDPAIEENAFIDGILDRYTEENDDSVNFDSASDVEFNNTEYSGSLDSSDITDHDYIENIEDDPMSSNTEEANSDPEDNNDSFEFNTEDLLGEDSSEEYIDEVLAQDETEDLDESEVENLFDSYTEDDDDAEYDESDDVDEIEEAENEGFSEEYEGIYANHDEDIVHDEDSVINFDEDLNYEVGGNDDSEEEILEEDDFEDEDEDVSEHPQYVNHGFTKSRNVSLPEALDTAEISLISSVDFDEEGDSDDPITPEGTFKSLGIDTNDFSSIFEDLIKEKQNAAERLNRIPETIMDHQEELTHLHTSLEESENGVDQLEEELDELRVKRDEVIVAYDKLSGELDDKSARVLKKKHRIRQISVLLEKLETEQEFYSNTMKSAEQALEKAKQTNPQTVNSFTDVLDRIQHGDADEEDLETEDEEGMAEDFFEEPDDEPEYQEEAEVELNIEEEEAPEETDESESDYNEEEPESKLLDSDQISTLEGEGGGVIPASKVEGNKFRGDYIESEFQEEEEEGADEKFYQ